MDGLDVLGVVYGRQILGAGPGSDPPVHVDIRLQQPSPRRCEPGRTFRMTLTGVVSLEGGVVVGQQTHATTLAGGWG